MCTNQRLLRIYCGDIQSNQGKKRGKSFDFLSEGLELVLETVRREKVPPEVSFLDIVQEGNKALLQVLRDLERWGVSRLTTKEEFLALAGPRIKRVVAVFLEREKEEKFWLFNQIVGK